MPIYVPTACCTESQHWSMHISLSSSSVSRYTLVGYPSYACNRACALLSPSPCHYAMAKLVPTVQLATHVYSKTLYSWLYGVKSKFFWLDGLILFHIIMGQCCTCCELHYLKLKWNLTLSLPRSH